MGVNLSVNKRRVGGEGGIRTLDELLTHTHFPGVLLQPLGHLSWDCWRRPEATPQHTYPLLPLLPSGPDGVHSITLRGDPGPPWDRGCYPNCRAVSWTGGALRTSNHNEAHQSRGSKRAAMTISWLSVASLQALLLALALGVLWFLARRDCNVVTAGGDTSPSPNSPDEPETAAIDPLASVFPLPPAAPVRVAAEPDASTGGATPLSDTQQAWMRLRDGLTELLTSGNLTGAAGRVQEARRLLHAADRLHGVPSPAPVLAPDADPDGEHWQHVLLALSDVRVAARERADHGDLPPELTVVLTGIVATADELRGTIGTIAPPETRREHELKQIIRQFTQDSRDMLASIRRLEIDNAALRDKAVEGEPQSVAQIADPAGNETGHATQRKQTPPDEITIA